MIRQEDKTMDLRDKIAVGVTATVVLAPLVLVAAVLADRRARSREQAWTPGTPRRVA